MSKELVESFRLGHQAIIYAIDQVLQYTRSYQQVKPKLRELDEILLNHFKRQDHTIYDRLNKQHHHHRESVKMLEFLLHDLKDIKVKYLVFVDKHSGSAMDHGASSFPREFQQFASDIITRIKIEEEYLFPLLKDLPTTKEKGQRR